MYSSQEWWSNTAGGGGGDPGDPIGQSLRFRGAATALTRDDGVNAQGTYTYSFWAKISQSKRSGLFSFGNSWGPSSTGPTLDWDAGTIQVYNVSASSGLPLTGRYRDPSAWYHFVYVNETGVGTRVFVNGEERFTSTTVTGTSSNTLWAIGDNANTGVTTSRMDGYLAECYFIDGQALEPTAFGRYNSQGVWVPVDYSGAFGSNGFKLTFEDPSNIGKDYSGNGNDFTATGFELANQSSADYDLMQDSPTQNWATLNPLNTVGGDTGITAANLQNITTTDVNGASTYTGTISMREGGRYYFEVTAIVDTHSFTHGIVPEDLLITTGNTGLSDGVRISNAGDLDVFGANTNDYLPDFSTGDVLNVAYDSSNGRIWFGRNGTFVGDPAAGTNQAATVDPAIGWVPYVRVISNGGEESAAFNAGQQPFLYTPPDGFSALQTQNLPAATIPDGRDHFQAITGPGDGLNLGDPGAGPWSSALRVGSGAAVINPANAFDGQTGTHAQPPGAPDNSPIFFEPDGGIAFTNRVRVWANTTADIFLNGVDVGNAGDNWVEIATGAGTINTLEIRATSGTPWLNAVEVDNVVLRDLSILAQAQQTFPQGLWWIKDRANINQHQLVDSVTNAHQGGGNWAFDCPTYADIKNYVAPAGSSVAWCWNYNNANPAENGFEIIIDNQATASEVINHRLGVVPDMIISRGHRFTNGHWRVHFKEVGYSETLFLSTSGTAAVTDQRVTAASTTTFTYGNEAGAVGQDFTHYVFAAVPGYSAFGSYTGNGSADGPFIYTGFRPAFILTKRATASEDWSIVDTTINDTNPAWKNFRPNQTNGEGGGSGSNDIDILSNGFKLRNNTDRFNGTGTYVYACFGENPFSCPVTAR